MLDCFIVGAGGFLGSVLRYLIGLLEVNTNTGFPIKTFLINIFGAFVIGIVASIASKNAISPKLELFLKVGICGGFTTFSSFALETEKLFEKGFKLTALAYVVLSILCGVFAVYLAEKIVINN
ncbi:MAG: fluoride efflux transporter CrcB [Peptoniphilaceae bacterium]|nr:fluoride efflux transporter CrcB [Peptoniphilaceae bacterium]MDY6018171.1 fluoride efflux transporter CrcB [Anaerococcus sp.]